MRFKSKSQFLFFRLGLTVLSLTLLVGLFEDCSSKFTTDQNQLGSAASPAGTPLIDGTCGSANNTDFATAPTTHLCNTGNPSGVMSSGPTFTWFCASPNGGQTVTCQANVITNGACGPANNDTSLTAAPAANTLCSTGNASAVTGTGTSADPFAWSCAGTNTGTTAPCSSVIMTATTVGKCGSANGLAVANPPTTNLCISSNPSMVTTGATTFTWTCTGTAVGSVANCTAPIIVTPPATCSGTPPAMITLPLPTGVTATSQSWASGGQLTLPHPAATESCSACHTTCGTGAPNTLIGYDHSNPSYVCNYCHDPANKVVNTAITTGSMANYRASQDGLVCTCCHNGTNNTLASNVANSPTPLTAAPATPILPSNQCNGASTWQLVYPTFNSLANTYSGGQFFGGH